MSPQEPSPLPPAWTLRTLGVLACVIGGGAVLGWHLGLPLALRWSPKFPVMVYDTAWSVTLGGLGLLSLASVRRGWARGIGVFLLAMGLGHLAFDPSGGVGYRDFLPKSVPSDLYALLGKANFRMAPSTAVAFGLLGVAFGFGGAARWRSWIGAVAASIVLLLACASLMGIATGFGFYLWGGIFLGMALPTALAFGILGGGLLVWEWDLAPHRRGGWPEWAPVPASALVLGCALVLGQSHQSELRSLQKAQDTERASRAVGHLQDEWRSLALQLEDLAWSLQFGARGEGAPQQEEMARFLGHHPGARSLVWVPATEQGRGWAGEGELFQLSPAGPRGRLRMTLDAAAWSGAMLHPLLPSEVTVRIHPGVGLGPRPVEATGAPTLRPFALDGTPGVLELSPDPRDRAVGRRNALGGLVAGVLLACLVAGLMVSAQGGRERATRLGIEMKARSKAERRQQEFLAVVSHELRTPLTAIQGALRLLRHLAAGALSSKDLELIEMADRNSVKLLRLVNDLLDMEKLTRGQVTLVPKSFELGASIRVALSNHEPTFRSRGISSRFDAPDGEVWIQGDPHRLEQVVTNLLSNATKFSHPGGEVVAALSVVAGEARIEIRDRGQGIPEAFREEIFKPFTQAEGANVRREGGTGLGLAISKALVEAMGGRIGFESEEGQGTTFWIAFTALAPPDRESSDATASAEGGK